MIHNVRCKNMILIVEGLKEINQTETGKEIFYD